MNKQRILVVDDNAINRAILADMLSEKYEVIEAEDGDAALAIMQNYHLDIDLVLLDLVMPKKDGLGVLKTMNNNGWIGDIPVIMISAETSAPYTRQAYDLGAEDYISRPFDPVTVAKRIQNAIILHAKQKKLMDAVAAEFKARERQNDMMIYMLSHIVEYRNGESGIHVLHINTITGMLLHALMRRTDKYGITEDDIPAIRSASSFHDIGKIAIPSEILNKPGRLTPEEFEIMKTHSAIGAGMIDSIDMYEDEPLIKYSRQICRWHHERFDGRGYPNGLVGDEIPISAQVVSLADVYDALTSERCYKPPYSHEQALEMIRGGQCGVFNPLLLDCLSDIEGDLRNQLGLDEQHLENDDECTVFAHKLRNELKAENGTDVSRNVRLLRAEQRRVEIFKEFTDEPWFEYFSNPAMITLNRPAAELLGLPARIDKPLSDAGIINRLGNENIMLIRREITERCDGDGNFDLTFTTPDGVFRMAGIAMRSEDTAGSINAMGRIIFKKNGGSAQ